MKRKFSDIELRAIERAKTKALPEREDIDWEYNDLWRKSVERELWAIEIERVVERERCGFKY